MWGKHEKCTRFHPSPDFFYSDNQSPNKIAYGTAIENTNVVGRWNAVVVCENEIRAQQVSGVLR